MILDSGICAIFRQTDAAGPGEKPRPTYTKIGRGWYGELAFETSPARPTEGRRELRTDARIRILQNREIKQNDLVVLRDIVNYSDMQPADASYRITRAYHGPDETGVTLITDLSLEVYRP